jgi:hypothetical protein
VYLYTRGLHLRRAVHPNIDIQMPDNDKCLYYLRTDLQCTLKTLSCNYEITVSEYWPSQPLRTTFLRLFFLTQIHISALCFSLRSAHSLATGHSLKVAVALLLIMPGSSHHALAYEYMVLVTMLLLPHGSTADSVQQVGLETARLVPGH